jgi:hypothetical protein
VVLRYTLPLLIILVLWSRPAYAYLDPGTGSMILATILGGVAGLLVMGKVFWRRILAAFGVGKQDEDKEDAKS